MQWNHTKFTQISKFNIHDPEECSTRECAKVWLECQKSLDEFESLEPMIYEFMMETIRLDNHSDAPLTSFIGDNIFKTKYLIRINKMMLHNYSQSIGMYRLPPASIVEMFDYDTFLYGHARESIDRANEAILRSGGYAWATKGIIWGKRIDD